MATEMNETRCRHIDSLRKLILEEPYDSLVWSTIERILVSGESVPVAHKMHLPSFYAGVLSALAIVADHDERTLFDEIVDTIGEVELVKRARRDGAMRWSGLSKYGYGHQL